MPNHVPPLDRLEPMQRLRLERGAAHLARLGPRALSEFLAELASRVGGAPAISSMLVEYERLTPAMLRATGGDRFARRLQVVP